MSNRMAEYMLDRIPEYVPDRTPEYVPDRISEYMLDRMQEYVPKISGYVISFLIVHSSIYCLQANDKVVPFFPKFRKLVGEE